MCARGILQSGQYLSGTSCRSETFKLPPFTSNIPTQVVFFWPKFGLPPTPLREGCSPSLKANRGQLTDTHNLTSRGLSLPQSRHFARMAFMGDKEFISLSNRPPSFSPVVEHCGYQHTSCKKALSRLFYRNEHIYRIFSVRVATDIDEKFSFS